jgi:adenine-specific DNA-methyltransferase
MPDQPKTDQPDKLDLRSVDIAQERQLELLRLFPEVRTEGDKLDFDRLKLALGEAVDVGKERYGMSWPGKADCFRTIQAPSLGTLRPSPEEGVAFDTTENLIVEGDNLEVLKLLQKSYLGKVKMIYIDPPYNTGNDFIYPDNYTESMQTYLEYTGQVDDQGHRFGTNTDTDGRFHSKWLNMMYPRLYLARNLLREDGVVFISIDDNEIDNLRKLCDDVFGAENFIAVLVRKRRMSTGMGNDPVSQDHEYVLAYARASELAVMYGLAPKEADYTLRDARGKYRSTDLTIGMTKQMRPKQFYAIRNPETGQEFWPPDNRVWRFQPSVMQTAIDSDGIIWPNADGRTRPRFKTRYDSKSALLRQLPVSTMMATGRRTTDEDETVETLIAGLNQEGTKELRDLLGDQVVEYPKPVSLLRTLLGLATRSDDIVLDFFAGSGTTAHAVLDLNKQDGGNRKFILVQLPEPTGREDYPTIADITKERVRRVITKLSDEDAGKLDLDGGAAPDRGFRVFKLAESNFKPWNAQVAHDAQALEEQLDMHVDHVREGRSNEDLLYEILLKSGFPLTTPVDAVPMAGKTVYAVAGGALFICLERELTLEVIRTMAGSRPERVVCLDEGFAGNDQLKANAVQIFKTKGVTSFKTV